MFQRLLGRDRRANRAIVERLYGAIVAAARQDALYSELDVPDTPLGRFEMVSLHMFLAQHRLKGAQAALADIAQELIDEFFLELDHSLRELGIGDSGVPRRMKRLAKMFYGRTASYHDALKAGDRAALTAALARNVRPDLPAWTGAAPLADYVSHASAVLARQPDEAILRGDLSFPRPQETEE